MSKKFNLYFLVFGIFLLAIGIAVNKLTNTSRLIFYYQELPKVVQLYRKVPARSKIELFIQAKEIQKYLGAMNISCISRFIEPPITPEKDWTIGCNTDNPLYQIPLLKDLQVRMFKQAHYVTAEIKSSDENFSNSFKKELMVWADKNNIQTTDYYFETLDEIDSLFRYRNYLNVKK
jgi:hypothetical protein